MLAAGVYQAFCLVDFLRFSSGERYDATPVRTFLRLESCDDRIQSVAVLLSNCGPSGSDSTYDRVSRD